jgi:hypothetical protein
VWVSDTCVGCLCYVVVQVRVVQVRVVAAIREAYDLSLCPWSVLCLISQRKGAFGALCVPIWAHFAPVKVNLLLLLQSASHCIPTTQCRGVGQHTPSMLALWAVVPGSDVWYEHHTKCTCGCLPSTECMLQHVHTSLTPKRPVLLDPKH